MKRMAENFFAACALHDASRCAMAVFLPLAVAASADTPAARNAAATAMTVDILIGFLLCMDPQGNAERLARVPTKFLSVRSEKGRAVPAPGEANDAHVVAGGNAALQRTFSSREARETRHETHHRA